ncbi:hypothetical protein GQ457_02G018310 [Hibiscus cannabinus]
MFRFIAAAIGKVVRVDYNTTEGKRGRFARLAIIVNLNKPLVSRIVIDGSRHDIEYEGLPEICYKCGKFGHSKEKCGMENSEETLKQAPVEPRDPSELYGPCMQVVNRRRKPGSVVQNQNRVLRESLSKNYGGSRFGILEEEGDVVRNEVDFMISPMEPGVGVAGGVRVAHSGNCGRVRIDSAPSSPKERMVGGGTEVDDGEAVVQRKDKVVGIVSEPVLEGLKGMQEKVVAKGVVVPAKSSLMPSKHSVVQVVAAEDGSNPRPGKGRVLPSSIWGNMPRTDGRKGSGIPVTQKLGVKQTKRDDRGHVNPAVHSSLASLVADLDRADGAVKDRNPQLQWRENSTFEQPGALDPVVSRSFRLLSRSKTPDIVAMFEPRISGGTADRFIRWSGFEFSYRRDSVHMDILAVSTQFVHGHCSLLNGEPRFFVTFIYASPEVGRRRALWGQLRALEPGPGVPWVLGGDLNVIGSSSERSGGSSRWSGVCSPFGKFMFDSGLLDMGFNGPQFTWRRGSLLQRLDRCLCNKAWYDYFPVSEVEGVTFSEMLASIWSPEKSFHENVLQFQEKSRKWSMDVFGHIGRRKRQLMARIKGIECALEAGLNPYLEALEKELKIELDIVLDQEESLWHQRARNAWIDKGDRNTKFFSLVYGISQKV